jgi:hypothetical protein
MSDEVYGICVVACCDVAAGICLDFLSIRTLIIVSSPIRHDDCYQDMPALKACVVVAGAVMETELMMREQASDDR